MDIDINDIAEFMNADSSFTFLSLGGRPISLKGNITKLTFTTYEDCWYKKGDDLAQKMFVKPLHLARWQVLKLMIKNFCNR